jgi:hypothetical protein
MKRLLPRVVPEAVGLLGLLVLAGGGCSPENNVKPGAPVLLSLAIVESGGTTTTVTADTAACSGGADGGTIKTQDACNPGAGDGLCKLKDDEWCRCNPDPDDMTGMKGTWNCDPFDPMSKVIATFDRLLDTDPLDPGDAATSRDDLATIDITPKPAVDVTTATDYSSSGSTKGAIFNAYGPFFGNQRSGGPSLQIVPEPTLPTSSSVEIGLVADKVRAKDGKTQFVGENLLADGSIKFKTDVLKADFASIPTAPPPPETDAAADDGGADGGVADGAASEAGPSEGGTDAAVAEAGGSEAGTDAGASEAGASEGGVLDAGVDTGVLADASVDAPKVDAAVDVAAVVEAGSDVATPEPPTAGPPVPVDMAMAAVVLEFNNVIDAADVAKHIKVTEDGQAIKVTVTAVDMTVNKVNILPGDPDPDAGSMHAWTPGKTYVITVDPDVTDVVGDKLGGDPLVATFMMAAK